MTLNIKSAEVHSLASAIAEMTGETLTGAVRQALRERYNRLQQRGQRPSAQDLLAIGQRASADLKRPYLDHADLLYDEDGLPE